MTSSTAALSLTRVGINGFRGLRSLELQDLGRINILVGSNNSGKTTVLEALSLICQPTNPDEWLAMIGRRDFGRLDETRLQSLRWCFARDHASMASDELVEARCEFTCDGAFPLRKLQVCYNEFFGVPSPEEMKRWGPLYRRVDAANAEQMRAAVLELCPGWTSAPALLDWHGRPERDLEGQVLRIWEFDPGRFRRPARGARIACETLTPYSYQLNRFQVRSQSRRAFAEDSPSVRELLQDFDPDVLDIDVASYGGERPAIYINHRRMGIAPLSIFGDAMRRSVLLAATLPALRDGGILLVDEVETGIHVSALGRVFAWLANAANDLGVQVIVTTHSLEALDALVSAPSQVPEEEVAVFRLTAMEDRIHCKRFSGDLLHRLRFERGLDVR